MDTETDFRKVGVRFCFSRSPGSRCQRQAANTKTMTKHLYEARYSGGPYNGCAVIGTSQRGEHKWSIPVPISSDDGRAGSAGGPTGTACRAVYKLRRTCHLIDFDLGMSTIRYEYEFIGYESPAPVVGEVSQNWFARIASFLRRAIHSSPWLPQPEGRPEGLGQGSALTCPSPGLLATRQVKNPGESDNTHRPSHGWYAWLLCGILVFAASIAQSAAAARPISDSRWQTAASPSFRIYKWQSQAIDAELAPRCEAALARLSKYWFGETERLEPKCAIVVYPTDESYCRAVGLHARYTSASLLIGYQDQKPFYRIDVRGTRADWEVACLPHELTHALFSQRFAGRKLPKWIDEGTAILADPPLKQARHLRDFDAARANGSALPLTRLMSLADYPGRCVWPTFYGESLSLVRFLVEQKSPQAFVEFIDKSRQQDQRTALRDVYGIRSVDELQQKWSQYIIQQNTQPIHVAGPFPRIVTQGVATVPE